MACPAFFVFISPECCTEQLTLPPSFTRCVRGELPERVVLRHRNHNYWQVKVQKIDDSTCFQFQAGWVTFFQDNSIQIGDLLVFDYLVDGMFNVKIFDVSSREKKGSRKYILKGIDWHEKFGKENEHEKGEYIEVADDNDADIKEVNEEMEDNTEDTQEVDVTEVDQDDVEMEREEDMEDVGEDDVGQGLSNEISRQKRRNDIYGTELFQSGLAVQPRNPYFLVRTTRQNRLPIPMDFVNSYSIDYEKVTYLVDPMNEEWRIKFRRWKDGRVSYTKGWRSFCQSNFVDTKDTCICEFLDGNRGPYIKVSIIRANQLPN